MKVNLALLIVEVVGMFLVIGLLLFFAAGTIAWTAGWIFLLLFFVFTVLLSLWLLRYNPGLLTERMTGTGKADQKGWDKIFFALANLLFIGWIVLMPLDAMRFHWSQVPIWLQVIGALLLLSSFYLFFLTFRENSYLSPAVRIQQDRGHTVVSTGPYHYIRHPMYAAALVFLVGISLLLGSWYGLIVGLALIIAVSIRAVQEERTLIAELPGYDNYITQVRYRLIPYIW